VAREVPPDALRGPLDSPVGLRDCRSACHSAFDSPVSDAAQVALARLVSLLAGVGCLVVVFLCTAELTGAGGRLQARCAAADPAVPVLQQDRQSGRAVLFWFGLAMLGFVRIIRYNRLADYLLLGTGAAAAVATKDQHYANLALLPIAVLLITR